MKTRRYLNVGPRYKAQPGEFFDSLVGDYFTEHELGKREETKYAEPEVIIPFESPPKP
jgi:hypothetical protein